MDERNEVVEKQASNDKVIDYQAGGETVKLSPSMVRQYLVSGDPDKVSFQEVAMFINLCKFNHLNPWLKEAYLIKYGNSPATMVVGKEAFLKRAEANKNYDGCESGIIVEDENGLVQYRTGTMKRETDTLIGGYAEVWRKDREHSTRVEVSMSEYSTGKSNWASKPATMIRKVAQVQALREAFPGEIGGMYTEEEQGTATAPEKVETEVHNPFSKIVEAEVVDAEIVEEKKEDISKEEADEFAAFEQSVSE